MSIKLHLTLNCFFMMIQKVWNNITSNDITYNISVGTHVKKILLKLMLNINHVGVK